MVARHVISTRYYQSPNAQAYLESHRSACIDAQIESPSDYQSPNIDAQIESPSDYQSPNRSSNLPLRNWSLNIVTHRRNSLCIAI